ncbi:coagulation factor XIII B chain-like isoform 2-T2 [Discoglossus pictus]
MSALCPLLLALTYLGLCIAHENNPGIGESCGSPPIVQFGDTITERKAVYASGTFVEYKCPEYYELQGNKRVRCENGVWEDAPVCTEPCTIGEREMEDHNIQLRWTSDKKLYIRHADFVGFVCKPGYEISDDSLLRVQCERGFLKYPKCAKFGIGESCGSPPIVQFGDTITERKAVYASGTFVEYKCPEYYELQGNKRVRCENGVWEDAPVCTEPCTIGEREMEDHNIQLRWRSAKKLYIRHADFVGFVCKPGYEISDDSLLRVQCERGFLKYPKCAKFGIGESCGLPPIVQFGDTITERKAVYASGTFVEYKCPEYYELQGNKRVRCENGVWEDAPVCTEPCTIGEREMEDHNIQLRWNSDKKLYIRHADFVGFVCKTGYEISDDSLLRVQCERGFLKYPKCAKFGSCILSQTEMEKNSIYINKTFVDNGEIIMFQCYGGMVPESTMTATCIDRSIQYPRCVKKKCGSTPKLIDGKLKTEQSQDGYDSDSSVEYECNEYYELQGSINVKCNNGLWSELPTCLKPCRITQEELDRNNIELKWSGDLLKIHTHNTEVNVKCQSGFRHPNQQSLKGECNDGSMSYPRCFTGSICRLNQETLDDNNLELDPNHHNEINYGEEDVIQFRCKQGFINDDGLEGSCVAGIVTYPKCKQKNACYINKEDLDKNNIEICSRQQYVEYFESGINIEFKCKAGSKLKRIRNNSLNKRCVRGIVTYPVCE